MENEPRQVEGKKKRGGKRKGGKKKGGQSTGSTKKEKKVKTIKGGKSIISSQRKQKQIVRGGKDRCCMA